MDSDKYIEILKLKLLPFINLHKMTTGNKLIFQQDNAPCHKSFKTCKFFSENNIEVMFWPPNSPDLNPIEMLWSELKIFVRAKLCSTVDEIIQAVYEFSQTVTPEKCQVYIQHLREKVTFIY